MKTLRDYCCGKCGKQEERYAEMALDRYPCNCGGEMVRLIGMPKVMLDGTDAGFPGAYDKWARIREENARIKSKRSYAET